MNIEELRNKHSELDYRPDHLAKHTKLSIQFTIETLKECSDGKFGYKDVSNNVIDKIEELTKYLK